jgi:hypothetical protein
MVYDSDGTISSRFTYNYDATGNKTEEDFYSGNGYRTGKLTYAYDGGGKLLTQTSFNADDTVSWRIVNTYDAKGNKIESVQYQGDVLRYRFFYKYDGKGRVAEQETREYNAKPNVSVSHAPVPGRVVYVYDDEKRTREVVTYDERGSLKSRLVHAFDEQGSDLGVNAFNADGSPKPQEIQWYEGNTRTRTLSGTASVKYVFDAQGNWTRKTYMIKPADADNPEPYAAEYRVLTYY